MNPVVPALVRYPIHFWLHFNVVDSYQHISRIVDAPDILKIMQDNNHIMIDILCVCSCVKPVTSTASHAPSTASPANWSAASASPDTLPRRETRVTVSDCIKKYVSVSVSVSVKYISEICE